MRVGIVCHSSVGGSVRVATALAGELARRAHEVHVITPARASHDWLAGARVTVHSLPVVSAGAAGELQVDWQPGQRAAFATLLERVVRRHCLQVLHLHYAVPFAHLAPVIRQRLAGAAPATVLTLHGTDVTVHGREPRERRRLTASLAAADAVTTVSRDHARLAGRLFELAVPPAVIPNFVDRGRFAPRGRPATRRPRVVHVSNFRRVKDPLTALRVFLRARRHADAELWLVGDGPQLPAVRKAVAAAGAEGAVRVLGVRHDVAGVLRQADVLLMSSITESFCLAALEAMSCGLPVVATDVGGVSEVVAHGTTGRLFAVGDHAAGAAALAGLLERRDVRMRLGKAGRRRAAEFAADRIVPRYERLYGSLLTTRTPRPTARRRTAGARS